MTGKIVPAGNIPIDNGFMECDTVDECFFSGHTEHFKKFPFDEVTCDGWHLYAAEACLQTKSNYVLGGGHIFICEAELMHL